MIADSPNARTWQIRSCRRLDRDTPDVTGCNRQYTADVFVCQLLQIKIYSSHFSVSSFSTSPKVSLVFSPTWRAARSFSRIHRAFIYQASTSLPPFSPVYATACMRACTGSKNRVYRNGICMWST